MSKVESGLFYSRSHEWVRFEGNTATMGISDHAQDQLGDVVFIEFPEVGADISKGDVLGVIESVKAVSDLYSPISGVVESVNDAIADTPETINSDCYGDGWCVKFTVADADAVKAELLTAEDYSAFLDG